MGQLPTMKNRKKCRLHGCLILFASMLFCCEAAPGKSTTQAGTGFVVSALCGGTSPCMFNNKDNVRFEITIRNTQKEPVQLPLEFMRSVGPRIVLHDNRAPHSRKLSRNMPNAALLSNVTVVAPDQSVSISGLITRHELEAFGGRHLDVTAEVSINAPTDGSSNFRPMGTATLRIIGADVAQALDPARR
jgi:hypothetical protein